MQGPPGGRVGVRVQLEPEDSDSVYGAKLLRVVRQQRGLHECGLKPGVFVSNPARNQEE